VTPAVLTRPGLHTTAFYLTFFMATGVHMPFWPLWLDAWGLTAAEVGLFTALGMAVRVVAGLVVPAIADRLDSRRHTIAVCMAVSMVLFVAHLWIGSKAVLLVATLAVGAAFAGIGPIAEALGVAAARAHGFAYAQSRGLGSVGFLGANLAVGALMASVGVDLALWWIVACLAVGIVLVARHPGGRRVQGQIPPNLREIGALIVNPVFALFVATVACIQASHAVFYALGSVHWARLGISEARIGALWAAGVGVEILFMVLIGTRVVAWLGPMRAMALSGLAGVVRWGAMMGDPTGWLLWPLQALHALTFAAGHLGAMAFITRAVPDRYGAAAQGAMGSMGVGLALAIGMALASALYPAVGGGVYGIGAVFAAAGLGLAILLGRRWNGGLLAV
jgi:PPP family 3-phenylpropionic acid transporter